MPISFVLDTIEDLEYSIYEFGPGYNEDGKFNELHWRNLKKRLSYTIRLTIFKWLIKWITAPDQAFKDSWIYSNVTYQIQCFKAFVSYSVA